FAGLCINRWSLEELVKRDPRNFIILLQQILRKTWEVLEQSQDELVVPLALLFSSTLLQTPHFSPDSGGLQEACEVFHCFLSWPEPCCSASRHLLSLIQQELRALPVGLGLISSVTCHCPDSSSIFFHMEALLFKPGLSNTTIL
uniref:Phosphoinositide 3-kinase regulatory subunit 5 n=1 Tax=Salmo trutta TaxID=8032 RepID=A0A673Y8H6_SALTR